jgi:rSAM-associated Gly-rich repeat protein
MIEPRKDRRVARALAELLPKGVVGVSMALAAADAAAATSAPPSNDASVAARLEALRGSVADAWREAQEKSEPYVGVDPETRLAWWGNGWRNGGWHNGGWRNGGWHNGGWHNGGWGNGWHNGGWGNGWHNGGWGNGWHNGGWGNGGWGNGLIGDLLSPLVGHPWGNGFRNW